MFLRLARLRFLIVRICFYSFLIFLLLQLLTYFNNSTKSVEQVESSENQLGKSIDEIKEANQQSASDERRLEQVKLVEQQNSSVTHNWTGILFDHYTKKLTVLNQRDAENNWKSRSKGSRSEQDIFEIYEETMVSKIRKEILIRSFVFFSRSFKNRNFVHRLESFIHNVRIRIVNGHVINHRLIRRMFVVLMYFIMLILKRVICKRN